MKPYIRFDRNEFSGAFGDIGTDFPLIVGIILASGLDCTGVLIIFGIMQILTGLIYHMPLPVQPLKAMAAIVISQKLSGDIILGGGLAIGILMLVLTLTGLLTMIGKLIPKVVVRGIQVGLGIQLASLALKEYVPSAGITGYWLTGIAFILMILLLGNRKYPAGILIILLGILYAFAFKIDGLQLFQTASLTTPTLHFPTTANILSGLFLLALPQIPLSIGNSMLATQQITHDLFPKKEMTLKKIGLTYSLMNIIAPFFGGIPVCHGSGGMMGHYALGARTGGSVIIYGSLYVILGLFFSHNFETVIQIFPLPILGTILFFEGLFLTTLIKDQAASKPDLILALLIALTCAFLKYGFAVGLIVGTSIYYLRQKIHLTLEN